MTTHLKIKPFWERLPAFALYPFKGSALIVLALFSLLITAAGFVPLIGWLVALVFWLGAYKQAFEMLLATASGRMDVPAVTFDVRDEMVLHYIFLQIVLMLVPYFAGLGFGEGAGVIAMLLAGLVTPAATISLVLTGDLPAALNPIRLFAVVARVGWPYVAMVGLTIIIGWTAADAEAYLARWMPALVADALGTTLSLWALFATFHLMGYMVWQYQEALGFTPDASMAGGGLAGAKDADLLARAEHWISEGELEAAITLLRREVRERAVEPAVHDLYRRALQLKGDSALLLEHARLLVPALLVGKQDRKALALIRESLPLDPDFSPFELADAERLVQVAAQSGQGDLALALLRGLLTRHDRHAHFGAWALQASDLVVRRGESVSEARAWLDRAMAQCVDEDQLRRVEAQRMALGI